MKGWSKCKFEFSSPQIFVPRYRTQRLFEKCILFKSCPGEVTSTTSAGMAFWPRNRASIDRVLYDGVRMRMMQPWCVLACKRQEQSLSARIQPPLLNRLLFLATPAVAGIKLAAYKDKGPSSFLDGFPHLKLMDMQSEATGELQASRPKESWTFSVASLVSRGRIR